VGFRGKQIVTLTLVAGVVAASTSLMNAAALARISLAEMRSRAELLAETLYHQASRVIREHPADEIREVLAKDGSLRSYAEAVVGYAPTTLFVAITDRDGVALLHSDPAQQGRQLGPPASLADFAERNFLAQLWSLARGHQVLEAELPFTVDGQPFGSVRVAVSTLLLKEELSGAIAGNAAVASLVVLGAFLASFYLANRLLRPIEMLRRELAQIDPGAGAPPLDLQTEADIGRIGEFFASLSRRLAEDRQLREAGQSFLETMLSGLADAVLVVNRDRRILSLNNPACHLLGQSRANLQGRPLEEVLADGHPLLGMVEEALSRGEAVGPRSLPLLLQEEGEEGGREVLHAVSAHLLSESQATSGVMLTARNMERLSRLGSHLSYSQKLSALGRLTSGVAHEIKNPLNAMVIHVALLRQKLGGNSPEAAPYLDVLDKEIRRLDRVIQGFLKFSRPEDLRLEPVPMAQVLEGVVRLLEAEARQRGVLVETELAEGLPPLLGDRELLQQAFVNLMLNACQAMPQGGRLRIAARRSRDGRVEIDVADTGVGIPPEELPKIFDLYYTTRNEGSGVGLSLVYRIIQLHDGDIRVSSTPGAGTRFTITLPEVPA
jgi:PAS domain S-box-containing protein